MLKLALTFLVIGLVAALFVENAKRFAAGAALKALVDRARGY